MRYMLVYTNSPPHTHTLIPASAVGSAVQTISVQLPHVLESKLSVTAWHTLFAVIGAWEEQQDKLRESMKQDSTTAKPVVSKPKARGVSTDAASAGAVEVSIGASTCETSHVQPNDCCEQGPWPSD